MGLPSKEKTNIIEKSSLENPIKKLNKQHKNRNNYLEVKKKNILEKIKLCRLEWNLPAHSYEYEAWLRTFHVLLLTHTPIGTN